MTTQKIVCKGRSGRDVVHKHTHSHTHTHTHTHTSLADTQAVKKGDSKKKKIETLTQAEHGVQCTRARRNHAEWRTAGGGQH